MEEIIGDYYKFLAVMVFHRTDKAFWTYHEKRLAECGRPFSRGRLAAAVCAKGADLLLNPKQTVEKILKNAQRDRGKHMGEVAVDV
jgi:hypothetical protein